MKKPTPSVEIRVTLTQVAKAAGVSLMTASYSMRNNVKISLPTRQRVQRMAQKMGYTPHPEISRLMHLLRAQRMPAYQATLGFLSFTHRNPHPATHRYTADVIEGARQRAAALGYGVDLLQIDSEKLSESRLTTMLRSRGIRGVLVPPLSSVDDCSKLLDWRKFSTVAATYSAQNLIVNRVVPNHQANIMVALTRLRSLGYRRVGLMVTGDLLLRANSAYQAAVALFQQSGDFVPIPALSVDATSPHHSAVAVENWLGNHSPDVLITVENAIAPLKAVLGRAFATTVGICLMDHSGIGPLAGIHQHPLIIGETAVELLAGQIQRGEIGFERHPRVTMVEGDWFKGNSLKKQHPT